MPVAERIALINNDFSVSRSADKLFLEQSALSQQIKRLEKKLDGERFIRQGMRLTGLTDFGKQVEQPALVAVHGVVEWAIVMRWIFRSAPGSWRSRKRWKAFPATAGTVAGSSCRIIRD